MLKLFINLSVYSVWFAIAVMFGLERYFTEGCQVFERYDEQRSHNWSRIVAIVMMVVVEIMYWRPLNQLWTLWKMEEEASFFTFMYLGMFAYGLHRAFCWLVDYFDDVGYNHAEAKAKDYSKHCSYCCFRATGRVTDLECPVPSAKCCPCLEDGYDIKDVYYLSEVMSALRKARNVYHRRGLEVPSTLSLRVSSHRVVVKKNPFDALFKNWKESDSDLGGINLTINKENPKTAKIIDFPVAAAAHALEPQEAIITNEPILERDLLQVRLIRGSYGSFQLRMTDDGISCRLVRELPDGRLFDQEVTFPAVENCHILDEFLLSEQGRLLYSFINAPTLTEKQLARLG